MLDEIADQVQTLISNFNTIQVEVHLLSEDGQNTSVKKIRVWDLIKNM